MATLNYIALVRSSALHPFLPFLQEIGSPVEKLLSVSKVPRKSLEDPNGLIPMASGAAFLDQAAKAGGLPNLGLLVGQRTKVEQLGTFGGLIRSSLTLNEALDTAQRMIASYDSSAKLWLERRGDLAWFCHRLLTDYNGGGHQASQYSLMLMLNLVRLAAGPDWKATAIHLQMPYNSDVAGFEAFKDTPLVFGQRLSAIVLPTKLLNLPLNPHGHDLWPLTWLEADALKQTAPALDLAGSVRQLLKTQLRDGYPGIQRLAESAGTSARTLQRRLNEEGIQYSHLVDEVRFDLAIELMNRPAVKMRDIARELGYRDCANFTRAFRRWAGVAPNEFRRQQRDKTTPVSKETLSYAIAPEALSASP